MPAPTTGTVIVDNIPLLVEPGTYVRGDSPLFSQPIRLGEPVALGPQSTWRQSSFLGGIGQEKWDDPQMWHLGTVDAREGFMKCRYDLVRASGQANGDNMNKVHEVRAASSAGTPHLYFKGGSLGRTLLRRDNLTGATTTVTTFGSEITAIGRSFYNSQFGLHIGLAGGDLWEIVGGSEAVTVRPSIDTGTVKITWLGSLGPKGDIAATANKLYRWVNAKWLFFASVDMDIIDAVEWNQRLFFIGHDSRNQSRLYVTDTTTTQPIYSFPNGFTAKGIALHSGVIYILGWSFNDEFTKAVGQLWSYNGQSVRLIYTVPDVLSDFGSFGDFSFWRAATYHQWLAFGFPHRGVYFYDPDQDAILPGPRLASVTDDAGNFITDVGVYGGRLIAANYNETNYHYEPSPKTYIASDWFSSEYDAGLPAQDKVWTEMRVRFKEPLPVGATVDVYVTTQHVESDSLTDPVWKYLFSVTNASTPGRKFLFKGQIPNAPIIGGGNFTDFRSEVLRLRLKLSPSSGSPGNDTPKVEAIEVDYFVLPKRRKSFSFQAIAANNLTRPDGAAYQYTHAQLEAALEALRANPDKQFFPFTDKDGTVYNCQFTGFTQFEKWVDPANPDGESSLYAIQLSEV